MVSAGGPFLTCQCGTVDIRNKHVGIDCQLGLEGGCWQTPSINNRTYVEDVKDPVEVLPPCRNRVLVALCAEGPRDRVSLALVDDLALDFSHSPVIETLVSGRPCVDIADSTYVVSCSIAPSTDRLSSSNRLPSKPRSRALHTSAQVSPRST